MSRFSKEISKALRGETAIKSICIRETPTHRIFRRISLSDEKKVDGITKSKHYPHEDLISPENLSSDIGPVIEIPRNHIFGRQTRHEYSERKRFLAIKSFTDDPDFLIRAPVIACLIPLDQKTSTVVIIDGHHRMRESGVLEYQDTTTGELRPLYERIPTRVFSLEEMAKLLNLSDKSINGKPYTPDNLKKQLIEDIIDAQSSFSHNSPSGILSDLRVNAVNISELKELFKNN